MALQPNNMALVQDGNRIISEHYLNKFALSMLNPTGKEKPFDLVTPRHPFFKMIEEGNNGIMKTAPLGWGPREKLLYETDDHSTMLSNTSGIKSLDFSTREGETGAQFYWMFHVETVTLDWQTYWNNQSALSLGDILEKDKYKAEKAFRNKQVAILWDGITEGAEKVWGINDAIRFVPSTESTRGPVGGVSISIANLGTLWRNNTANYNKAAAVISPGGKFSTFVDDEGSTATFYDLWYNCANHHDGDQEEGQPNLILVNKYFMKSVQALINDRIMLSDIQKTNKLGTGGFDYRGALVVEDPNVPDDPNTSTYGVAVMLNTRTMNWYYGAGMPEGWSDMKEVPGKTAWYWLRKRAYTLTWRALNRNGIFYGLKPREYDATP